MKDASAEILQIEAGLKSRTQALSERGFDAEQVDREIAAERAREHDLGLDFRRPGSPAHAPGEGNANGGNDDDDDDDDEKADGNPKTGKRKSNNEANEWCITHR